MRATLELVDGKLRVETEEEGETEVMVWEHVSLVQGL